MKPHAASALLAALVVLALAGCGSSGETTQTGSGGPPAAASTAPEPAPAGVRAKSCGAAAGTVGAVRVTGLSCGSGRAAVAAWNGMAECVPAAGESHSSCRVGKLVCIGAVAGRGLAVTCAGPGRSVAFVHRRD